MFNLNLLFSGSLTHYDESGRKKRPDAIDGQMRRKGEKDGS